MGKRLMDRIRSADPEMVLSDCLSCRLQFKQLLRTRLAIRSRTSRSRTRPVEADTMSHPGSPSVVQPLSE